MASMQEPAPGAKSQKFIQANPLGPMTDPFQNQDNHERDAQQLLSESIDQRMTKAMLELQQKHATGTNEVDDPDRAPTGTPYRQIQQQQHQAQVAHQHHQDRQLEQKDQAAQQRDVWRQKVHQQEQEGIDYDDDGDDNNKDGTNNSNNNNNQDSDDDEYDDLLDDPVLDDIRAKRLRQLQQAQSQHNELIARGHGQYRTISQDELLPECTGTSEWVAIHFFHSEFERCTIMDHHLHLIAKQHVTCKFLRIDAEKAPFFVSKLVIQTLPTLIVFHDGKAVNRLVGFEGLASTIDADNFKTSKLKAWLAESGGCIEYDIYKDETMREELLEERRAGRHGAIWSSTVNRDYDDSDM